ncbi:hypothetical protein [Parafrankia elaeagni]|uniref:hypothetical protein n=1 Tax=Parafrankia elaeagni TaxID=222534 RepID=UPI000372634A|nr:hypothetical protein [Parafrankia elaeagni]
MPDSQPANITKAPSPADASSVPDVTVRETGTGPFRYVVVDIPAGVHPVSLAKALRNLPIGCEFANMSDLAGTRSGGELRFRVHDDHGPAHGHRSAYDDIGTRVPRLDTDSPFSFEGPTGSPR